MFKHLFLLKSPAHFRREAAEPESGGTRRTLGLFSLIMLGLGLVVGAGIFTVPGIAAARYAGPGIIYSFLIAGFLCVVAGLCYAEMAGMLPEAGSAYAYSYATLGEFTAWIIGWDLCLEYGVGAVLVSVSWSGYLLSLVRDTLGVALPDLVLRLCCGPLEGVTLASGAWVQGLWNVPATVLPALLTLVLARSMKGGARLNNAIVCLKILIVLVFVALGIGLVSRANLVADPGAPGLLALVPARESVLVGGREVARYGWTGGGVLTGVGVVFLAYIGFDAVSTTGREARNPTRDVPLGILATVGLSTLLYVLVALVLTGIVPFRELGSEPIAHGIDRITQLRSWGPGAATGLAIFVKAGALAGLASGVLVTLMGQARILFAMGRDGLLPWFGRADPRTGSPRVATLATGTLVALAAGVLPLTLLSELVSIGTLMAFSLVCIGVPILRRTQPGTERPFRIPCPWFLGTLGAATGAFLMVQMPAETWFRLLVWLYLGFGLYFLQGRRNSRLQREAGTAFGSPWQDLFSISVHVGAAAAAYWAFTHGGHPLLGSMAALLAAWTLHALVGNAPSAPA
ncbi:amino acid permease [Mesoterricola silvestris]|uniref:Amino acid transporter n=1 Tax=Mesoterricola silvestris TaxID=2927979 RepID=A0AA48KA90_9BACT|nr:amino acid permease [Mesoterricola silvestris]BDU73865.1 amino acid transporter [Mesoterricola silvestris]